MKGAIVILAGGRGNRFGYDKPKQFVRMNGKPMFIWSLMVPMSLNFDHTVLVFNEEWMDEAISELEMEDIRGVELISGGRTRQLSVWNALKYLERYDVDVVLIHDANRPFATRDLYRKVISDLSRYDSCVPIVKPRDSVYRMEDDVVLDLMKRESLGLIQTPQGFRYDLIMKCHKMAIEEGKEDFPDDSSILLHFGYPIHTTRGELTNLKITFEEDMSLAKYILQFLESKSIKF